jgi:hypothetical protein
MPRKYSLFLMQTFLLFVCQCHPLRRLRIFHFPLCSFHNSQHFEISLIFSPLLNRHVSDKAYMLKFLLHYTDAISTCARCPDSWCLFCLPPCLCLALSQHGIMCSVRLLLKCNPVQTTNCMTKIFIF